MVLSSNELKALILMYKYFLPFLGFRQQLAISIGSVQVGASEIMSISSVRNLLAWFDKNMSMDAHVGKVFSKA